ncbi:uncharacterized protein LOC144149856 [Haemaphysalis longicornis]
MKPSTRAATLCCACAIALGPAAQALFHTPASGVQPRSLHVASLRAANHSPGLPILVSWRRAKLHRPGRKALQGSGRTEGGASSSVAGDPADVSGAAALWKLGFLSRAALLVAAGVGGLQCGSTAQPHHVPSTALKGLFRARKKSSAQHWPRIGSHGSPIAAWPLLGEPPTIGARSGGGGDSLAVKLAQGVLDKSHRLMLDLAGRVPNLVPRMDAQECLKRTVCEAHNKPGRYGLLGITLQFFFPPFRPGDAEGTRMSPLQLAARYGREPSADCGRQYDGCFLDLLQTLQGAVDYFLRRQRKHAAAAGGTTDFRPAGVLQALLFNASAAVTQQQAPLPPVVWGSGGYGLVEPITAPP